MAFPLPEVPRQPVRCIRDFVQVKRLCFVRHRSLTKAIFKNLNNYAFRIYIVNVFYGYISHRLFFGLTFLH